MKTLRVLILVGAVAWGGSAALALPAAPRAPTGAVPVPAGLVCGPYRCFRRPLWRYGRGVGFRPFRPFGPPPLRRFAHPPFGFGGFRR